MMTSSFGVLWALERIGRGTGHNERHRGLINKGSAFHG
jgi:hypothetical protein